ncbi:hypothetical protein [Ktedonobacter racemifer]|uniref:Uncharacterized protein n=1 Tax=Ktedonobacter racemifer DSM 44963 TaxID=485913 RepID=D6U145_KTERA|nr:hypothetical protein [Ktedonobacter racemifer]EFH82535.1 hypothetical protein Krac_3351 [Ktedonobacter racemifer DSM 44963]
MNKQQDTAKTHQRDITPMHLIVRVVIGGLLSAIVLTVFASLLSSGKPSATFTAQNIIIRVISGVFYVASMTPLARRVFYRRFPRFLAIFVPLYITGTLTDMIEAYFYTSLLTPFSLVAALIIEGLPLLFITGIIAWLIPANEDARNTPRFTQVMRERSFFSWIWRIVVAGVPYAAIYLFFTMLVTPLEHAHYYDSAFIASLHTVVPSTATTLVLEAVRGMLFVLAMLPIIAVMRKSRWSTGLYIALVGAVLEAWIPLLGQTSWPMMMRVGNVLELTGDACGRALLMALLVVLPSLQASRSAHQQLAADV